MFRFFHLRQQPLTFRLVIFLSLLHPGLASLTPSPRQYCVWACNEGTSYVTFEGSEGLDYYTNLCANELFLQSLSYCIQAFCTGEETSAGLTLQDDVCVANAAIHLPDLDDRYILPMTELDMVEEADMSLILETAAAPLDHAVVISRDLYGTAYRTTAAHFENQRLAYKFV